MKNYHHSKTKMGLIALLSFFTIIIFTSCDGKKVENINYDWKDISLDNQTDLTCIRMIDENVGFIGGNPKIDSFIYESWINIIIAGLRFDTLIFQTEETPCYIIT